SAQIREILISESAWEEMTCLFAPSLLHLVNRKPFPFFSKATGVDILNSFKCLIFLFSKH
ncbi:hypothetical protein BL147_00000155, partial [Klebsiella pneumoniae]